jgi:hypothetical protein
MTDVAKSCADVGRCGYVGRAQMWHEYWSTHALEYQAAVLQNRPVGQHEKRQRVRGRDGIGRLLNAVFFSRLEVSASQSHLCLSTIPIPMPLSPHPTRPFPRLPLNNSQSATVSACLPPPELHIFAHLAPA